MSRLLTAWQDALAAEHQAVFGYTLLGPRLTAEAQVTLGRTCQAAHEAARDSTAAAIAAAGHSPISAASDYPLLYPVASAAAAARLAAHLETTTAKAWRYLYAVAASSAGASPTRLRTSAQPQLTASAVRATQWRSVLDPTHATDAFPGI